MRRFGTLAVAGSGLLATFVVSPVFAQTTKEALSIARQHRGAPIQVPAELSLPAGSGKVPAMIIHHGSGGVTEGREHRYAREIVAMGVAAAVIDSFKPRGIQSTVSDQGSVSSLEMAADAFAVLGVLAKHPRIDGSKVGIVGFSKGGTVALMTAHERHAVRMLPQGPRFALHVPVYPACNSHDYKPKTTGAPILMLIGAADTYAGVKPCTEYADKLKAEGAKVTVKIFPGAAHGFDSDKAYSIAKGENWSRCVFEQQADRSWKEQVSGLLTSDAKGQQIAAAHQAALAKCRTLGVSGGPNPVAKAAAMSDLKAAIRASLLGVR